ncbi:flagellar hook-associated protein FlgK [Desulfosporosinus sp. FKA]|uniref:flagellar hook-associated protein FlgK n=1 Tax=Desulfosporosinus sp. FKA TaxID=1969834 RepID=UPI000B49CF92|nr:flagellar hook-associated protein FlgK [Desulfosporosinus sp. FKA]
MTSTFFGLEITRRALASQQAALDVTGNNISNANTEGYTRQMANLKETTPYTIYATGRNLSLGSGVSMDTVTRARDKFVDMELRDETSKQQYWTSRQTSLSNIESFMNEPSNNGLSAAMDNFWTAWSSLSQDPGNTGARSVVQGRAITLTDSFHAIAQQIKTMQSNLNSDVTTQIQKINSYADQIAKLNDQIKSAKITGDNPNDLLDSRDNLIDKLSKIVNVKVSETNDDFSISIGGDVPPATLVDNGTANHLDETSGLDGNDVKWESGDSLTLNPQQGTLQADIQVRDTDLNNLLDQYNSLAKDIVGAVNSIYGTGKVTGSTATGNTFFDPSNLTASTISLTSTGSAPVDDSVPTNINNIVTGDGTSGDGSIAAAIAALATGWSSITDTSLTSKASSLGDEYGVIVSQFGVQVQQTNQTKAGEDVLVNNLTNQRDSVSGVSLDEEMTNMIQYQKSYMAAARVVTTMDDMLSTIVTGLGVTR